MMESSDYRIVSLAAIKVGEYDVRTVEEDPELVGLAESIGRDGLINPLTVEQRGQELHLVAGHRRYAACLMARVVEVPVLVRQAEIGQLLRIGFSENFHRRDVSPMEQALRIAQVIDAGAMSAEDISGCFRRSIGWVHEQLAMLEWPADVQDLVHARELAPAAAQHLARIEDDQYRGFLLRIASENGCTERTASAWLAGWRANRAMEEVAGTPVAEPGRPSQVVTPEAVCMGCRRAFEPQGLTIVYVCPDCFAQLRRDR